MQDINARESGVVRKKRDYEYYVKKLGECNGENIYSIYNLAKQDMDVNLSFDEIKRRINTLGEAEVMRKYHRERLCLDIGIYTAIMVEHYQKRIKSQNKLVVELEKALDEKEVLLSEARTRLITLEKDTNTVRRNLNPRKRKLSKDQCFEINRLYKKNQYSYRELGKSYNVSHATIAKVVHATYFKD